ncbi:MAG: redoxin domain-containing protein [Phycisphaerales bacterium]|nr:MAG: redoxin domain-containing protein [Phycisphaerales bacterium]
MIPTRVLRVQGKSRRNKERHVSRRGRWAVFAAAGLMAAGGCVYPADRLVDTQAPDFTLESLDGEKVTLSEQRGKVVLLAFWGGG